MEWSLDWRESLDFAWLAIVEDFNVILVQIRNRLSHRILNGKIHRHLRRVHADAIWHVLGSLGLRAEDPTNSAENNQNDGNGPHRNFAALYVGRIQNATDPESVGFRLPAAMLC